MYKGWVYMIKVGIIGSTGYAGNELVRILTGHKEVEIKWYGSRSYVDKKYYEVYQNMFQIVDATCMDDNIAALAEEVDVIFTATPQGYLASLLNEKIFKICIYFFCLRRTFVILLQIEGRLGDQYGFL